jgi:hypothetical protein
MSNPYKIFGFEIRRPGTNPSLAPPTNNDGAIENEVTAGGAGAYGYFFDLNKQLTNEVDMVNKYRSMSQVAEIDAAIEDIVNEAIVVDDDRPPVAINIKTEEGDIPDQIIQAIQTEFSTVMNLLDFHDNGHDMFRQWYVDGRYYGQIVVDETNLSAGIQDIRQLDARKTKKVRDILKKKNSGGVDVVVGIDEYFLYSELGSQTAGTGIKLSPDTVIHAPSGLTNEHGATISYLHKAIKPANQLRYMEDAALIYTLSRAPSRRVFYIDIADMPKQKADQYMQNIMAKYKNKIVYDSCLAMDTKIPLLDGRTLTIAEIQVEFEAGKQMWAYSCDPVTGKFAPGMITSAGVTKFDQQVMRLTLDNGKTITCTYDHKFPVWGKGKTEAKDLVIGDSMIPFYTRQVPLHAAGKSTYEQIFDNEDKKWVFTHRRVSAWKDSVGMDNEWTFDEANVTVLKKTVHHINYDRYNNDPFNLVRMSNVDHLAYHKQHNSAAGKIGGKVTAQRRREQGLPYFIINDPVAHHAKRVAQGKRLGMMSKENGLGIFGLTPEQTQQNSIAGSKKLQELLQDPAFHAAFCEALTNSWDDTRREGASARAAARYSTVLALHQHKANASRWSVDDAHEYASKIQSIEYSDELILAVNSLIKSGAKTKRAVAKAINETRTDLVEQWQATNSTRAIKNWNPDRKFGTGDLDKIYARYGVSSWADYIDAIIHRNHKIVNIEYLDERMDVGTLGIDRFEVYHDHHTFALDAGIYTCNSSGEIKDDRVHTTMLEDYWLPRRSNGRATEITTLPSENITGQTDNVMYFLNKLYGALNVPLSRVRPDTSFQLGRSQEITRDEVKFGKFIDRLRKKFSAVFLQALRVQLILKGIITPEDWDFIRSRISFDYMRDNHFAELKDAEILSNRIQMANEVLPLVGKFYSLEYIRRRVLKLTDEEIEKIAEENAESIKSGELDMFTQGEQE